jgi:hypothetical protein
MTTNKRTNAVTQVMNEYVMWGGPIVTRATAYADCKAQGFDAKAIDILVFGRQAVPTPADPEAHVAFLGQIRAMESMAVAA